MSLGFIYAPYLFLAAFVLAIVAHHQWQSRIRPMLITKAEMDALAVELVRKHGERAREVAFIEEDRAWRYGETFEQGKWRRVRRELWRPDNQGCEGAC